jgi:hypothetical protein
VNHAVIPAPARFEAGAGPGFAARRGTVVAYSDTGMWAQDGLTYFRASTVDWA